MAFVLYVYKCMQPTRGNTEACYFAGILRKVQSQNIINIGHNNVCIIIHRQNELVETNELFC